MNIVGRLTRDAEIKTLQSNRQVVNFSVAVKDSFRNKEGKTVDRTEYFNCSYWISVKVAKLLMKGLLVELTGRVSARPWLSTNGEPRASLDFRASEIKIHGTMKNRQDANSSGPHPAETAAETNDIPF